MSLVKPSSSSVETLGGDLPIAQAPPRPKCRPRFFLLVSLLLLLCVGQGLAADKIVVLYPEAPEPYRGVFSTIIAGMLSRGVADFMPLALAADYDPQALDERLRSEGAGGIVFLGKRGYGALKALDSELPTIFGALRAAPKGYSGISLSTDPDILFGHLRSIAPEIEKVLLVYSPKINAWLIPLAEEAARKRGLKLISIAADSLQGAARSYRYLLEGMNPAVDSIWLPLDPVTVNDEVVLPMLLQHSWDRGLVVFSSKASHARRGVLFSTLPNNEEMGGALAEMAVDLVGGAAEPGVVPLADLRLVVNLRTADHLGLRFTSEQKQGFDLTFSSR